ncbi:MAG: VCBS repeat-containing protein [Candidatus Solibacter usitatus]|nr:VCBS repeat-containing protein [Candidatus Solibacter usitatus]
MTAASLLLAPLFLLTLRAEVILEKRGASAWPTRNHWRISQVTNVPRNVPLVSEAELPAGVNPDSIRVLAGDAVLPSKTDWRNPRARVVWLSTGAAQYHVYFDIGANGETSRLVEPAMIGAGDRLTYGRGGVRSRLSVGLWAHPAALDIDGDGDLDLIVSCTDRPFNGIYLFRNIGSNQNPLFDRGEWLGPSKADLVAADFDGDGKIDLAYKGGYFRDVRNNLLSQPVAVKLPRDYHIGRDDMFYPVDWDGDGKIDILNGVSDWREYGWDDAYDAAGKWRRGPLHGYVYFFRNIGTNANPQYAPPVKLEANGKPIDLYGSPAPAVVDWLGRGKRDLFSGSFLDSMTIFRNTGSGLGQGEPVRANGQTLRMDLCMIQPRVVSWHADGRPSLLIGEEDGRVALVENTAPRGTEPKFAAPRYLEQIDPYMKAGVLSRPVAIDWNGDGKLDLIAGTSAGYIQYFENTGTRERPEFTDRGNLTAGGKVIRRIAGPNGSVQGPAEEKWGYSNPSVADWDLDGKLDLLVNDIWGDVVWYRNTGTRTEPRLAPAQMVEVEWAGAPPKPDWIWWQPKPKQLVTQWRTTPKVFDWDGDGLPDLVMLNHQGYLCLYRRARSNGKLILLPPERIFVTPNGRFLNLSNGRAGASGRRKIEIADWDGDGQNDLITDSDNGPVWYRNTGTRERPVMQLMGTIVAAPLRGHNPTPNVADWNGDGKLDLMVGAEDGFFYYFDRNYIDRLIRVPSTL